MLFLPQILLYNKGMDDDAKQPTRRAFLTGATISISALLANSLAGCSHRHAAPNDAMRSEMESLRLVDPRFVTFRETSRIPTGLARPTGICVTNGRILWTVGDTHIVQLGASGADAVHPLPLTPTCIAPGPDGSLIVGLTDRVSLFRTDRRAIQIWEPADPRSHITSLDYRGGHIWVADWGTKTARGYDHTGRLLATAGVRDEASGYPGIIAPSPHFDVAIGAGDDVFLTNPGMHRVETFTRCGKYVGAWGTPSSDLASFCGCCNPTDIALLPGGGFVTSEKGIPRVKIYDSHGRFREVVASSDRLPSNAMSQDLAVLADGRIAVLDPTTQSVRLFTRVKEPTA